MLPSQRPSGPWSVDADISGPEFVALRRKSTGLDARTNDVTEHIVAEELTHIRSFGVTDDDRISTYLGLTTEALTKRRERAANTTN